MTKSHLHVVESSGESRRHPRRDPATFILRIELAGAQPPIWRRVEVPSTLTLDEVHALIQVLFGWLDCHLHQFALGESVFDPEAEFFLCPDDVEEGEEGTPEQEVRLDETLAQPGDVLHYTYDYGDEWNHLVTLEKVVAAPSSMPRFLEGEHEAPEEDSGGIHQWDDPQPLKVELIILGIVDWATRTGRKQR